MIEKKDVQTHVLIKPIIGFNCVAWFIQVFGLIGLRLVWLCDCGCELLITDKFGVVKFQFLSNQYQTNWKYDIFAINRCVCVCVSIYKLCIP